MTYKTNEGKTYAIVGTVDGTVSSASGVVIASFTANKQAYFTAPVGGFVTISDDTAIVTPVFKLAPSALVGEGGGGDSPAPSGNSDFVGYIEYDDATGAMVDLSIPKYTTGNLTFKSAVFPENYEWTIDMPYLTDGSNMFQSCTNLTSFSGDLSGLTNGNMMFAYSALESISSDLSSLTDMTKMFYGCTNLASFNADLPKVTNGSNMFQNCTNLRSFSGDLSALTDGSWMFQYCSNLTSFEGDLTALVDGHRMFYKTSLTEWNTLLPALTDGYSMFSHTHFQSFSCDLSALTNGYQMFFYCENLTSFSADLSALSDGEGMFSWCQLDAASVEHILSSIPTYTDGSTHQLNIHFSSEAAAKFEEITGLTPIHYEQAVSYKGWTIRGMIYTEEQ